MICFCSSYNKVKSKGGSDPLNAPLKLVEWIRIVMLTPYVCAWRHITWTGKVTTKTFISPVAGTILASMFGRDTISKSLLCSGSARFGTLGPCGPHLPIAALCAYRILKYMIVLPRNGTWQCQKIIVKMYYKKTGIYTYIYPGKDECCNPAVHSGFPHRGRHHGKDRSTFCCALVFLRHIL